MNIELTVDDVRNAHALADAVLARLADTDLAAADPKTAPPWVADLMSGFPAFKPEAMYVWVKRLVTRGDKDRINLFNRWIEKMPEWQEIRRWHACKDAIPMDDRMKYFKAIEAVVEAAG